jgi:hypothetical protein
MNQRVPSFSQPLAARPLCRAWATFGFVLLALFVFSAGTLAQAAQVVGEVTLTIGKSQIDRAAGAAEAQKGGSVQEGDVIRTIEKHHQYIGHYHTGGNPGRAEIDETQELNYRRIVQAIVDTGFKGYLGQEFIPRKDAMTSLEAAYKLCRI